MKNDWDLIIIGSGPSGLATALAAKLNGVEKVLVLEKNQGVGSRLIGQSIHYKPDLLNKIFQGTIPEKAFVSKIKTFGRIYYSPSGKNNLHIEDNVKRVWIDFRIFLEEFSIQVMKIGVKLRTSSEVVNIEDNKNGNQVVYVQDHEKKIDFQLNSRLNVVAAGSDVFNSKLVQSLNIQQPTPICPIIASHFTGEYNKEDMEFFFYSDVENGVAATSYIFPHFSDVAEFGVIVFPDASRQPLSNIWTIWQKAIKNPKVKDIIDPLKIFNITTASISMGGPISKLYTNNLFVVGEAAGHVTPTGGSGILNGLEMGFFLGEQLGLFRDNWCEMTYNTIESKLLSHPIHEKLDLMAKMIIPYRKKIFLELGTWERIDSEWDEISSLLSLAFGQKS